MENFQFSQQLAHVKEAYQKHFSDSYQMEPAEMKDKLSRLAFFLLTSTDFKELSEHKDDIYGLEKMYKFFSDLEAAKGVQVAL